MLKKKEKHYFFYYRVPRERIGVTVTQTTNSLEIYGEFIEPPAVRQPLWKNQLNGYN